MKKESINLKIIIAFTCVYIIWGSTYLAIRFAVDTIPPFLMAGIRFVTAGIIMTLWGYYRSGIQPTIKQWGHTTVIGGLLLLGGNGCVVWAEQVVPSGITALIISTVPLWMVVFNWFSADRTRPSFKTLSGIFIGLFGIALLVGPEPFHGDSLFFWGIMALIAGSGLWSAGSIYSKTVKLPESMILTTGMEMLTGGSLLLLLGFFMGEPASFNLATITVKSTISVLYLIVFGSLIAFTAYIWLLDNVDPARVSTYAFVNPVIAVFLGWFLGNEPMTIMTLAAAAVIVFAVFLITTSKK